MHRIRPRTLAPVLAAALSLATLSVAPGTAHAWGERNASYSCSGYWISSSNSSPTKYSSTRRVGGSCGGQVGAFFRTPGGNYAGGYGDPNYVQVSTSSTSYVGGGHRPCYKTCALWNT